MSERPTDDAVIAAQADDVTRGLSVDIDGSTQHAVQSLSQTYPTSVDDLWEACTDPERLARWFAPVVAVMSEPKFWLWALPTYWIARNLPWYPFTLLAPG